MRVHERQKEKEITLENELSNVGDNITMSVLIATQSVLLHMVFSNNDNDCRWLLWFPTVLACVPLKLRYTERFFIFFVKSGIWGRLQNKPAAR